MIESKQASAHPSENEHVSMISYVVGYIFSLLFTAIPFYLVINKSLSGNQLLATILGFAGIQMIIQIIFFLHLGRGPKPLYNIAFFVSTVGIITLVVGGSIFIMSNLYSNLEPTEAVTMLAEKEGIYQVEGNLTGACDQILNNHQITISNGIVEPEYTIAGQCDTITFINLDDKLREMTFGVHPYHSTYAGIEEIPLKTKHNETITLNQSGTYQFHDHLDPSVAGYFNVTPKK